MSKADGRTLYRIPQSGKVAGVCAGIADYFNFETWLVRVAAASIFLLGEAVQYYLSTSYCG